MVQPQTKKTSNRAKPQDQGNLVHLLLQQTRDLNSRLVDQITAQAKVMNSLVSSAGTSQKLPGSKSTTTITEPVMSDRSWWVEGDFNLTDNKQDRLELGLRLRLGAVNANPKVIS